jgi:predicted nucleotidyltransferase component of viral defense system
MVTQPFPKKIHQGSLLQLILLHGLYGQSGSDQIIFQGGTALRWIYGGQRASEDLDFVSSLSSDRLRRILKRTLRQIRPLSLSQFGPGSLEERPLRGSTGSFRTLAIFRPETQRERIAVRIEVEQLRSDVSPLHRKVALMDCPPIFNVMREGSLTLPYSSSILSVETPEEILTDKLRALLERSYLKGRDLYDLWFLHTMLGARTNLVHLSQKLDSYFRPFRPARGPNFFLKKKNLGDLRGTLETDLRLFLPSPTYHELEISHFATIFDALREILNPLLKEGLEEAISFDV